YDFPKQVCVLTKVNPINPLVCERVEIYLAGKEVGNGYTELIDAQYQEERFKEEALARKKLGLKEIAFDHDLIDALKSGLPDVAGIGIGLDRVAMVFADAKYISDINYFPVSEW
ncbi:partial Lysine--tRNA ligase, heat inducible, partial [Patescibacteria group bacterium]